MRPLTDLFAKVTPPPVLPAHAASIVISHITADSRQVTKGSLFAALPGEKADGAAYAAQAVAGGAVAVL